MRLLAQLQIDARFRGHLDPSDLAQQTLLEAHQQREHFRGSTEGELAAWLRQMLKNNLKDEIRRLTRDRRDVRLEQSLLALDKSSARVEAMLAADQTSPSKRAARNEELLQMAQALEKLPPAQQEAVRLHHLMGWSLSQVAEHLGRSQFAVVGLLNRGLQGLRKELDAGA
jgi:RNA polymerase sigma-70 factor (ECF subfamily)